MKAVVWLLVLAAWLPAAAWGGEVVKVEATGSGDSEDEAVADALRKAVEKGAGVEVTSRTETLDHEVAFDRIVTRAQGYVTGYEVVERSTKFGLHRVKIAAEVDKGKIQSDWGEIQMLLDRKGRPTVMVLVKESVFDREGKAQDAMTDFASAAIEQLLLDKGFSLKSAKGLQEIEKRNRDAAVAANDLDALAAIAKSYGANVMIVGNSTCRYSGEGKAHGVDLVHYKAAVSITSYNSDTGDLILSTMVEDKGSGMGEFEAITLAFKRAAEKVSDEVLKQILNRWYFEFQHGSKVQLHVTLEAPDEKGLRRGGKIVILFQELLKEIEGVKHVKLDFFDKEEQKTVAKYTVETTLTTESLRNKVIMLETKELGVEMEWTGSDKNSLRFVMHIE